MKQGGFPIWTCPSFFVLFFVLFPEGPARHLDASLQKLTPHCLAAIFDLRLPSPKSSLKMPLKLPLKLPGRAFLLIKNNPRGEGNCAATKLQKLSRGNFCLAASRCLSRLSGFGTFPIFAGFSRFVQGLSLFVLFLFLGLLKCSRHNPDLSRKERETPRFGNPPVYLLSIFWPSLCSGERAR